MSSGKLRFYALLATLTFALFAASDPESSPAENIAVGPYLIDMKTESATICFRTDNPCGAGIVWRSQDGKWRTTYDVSNGQIQRRRALHRITLQGLKPGSEYEYRILLFLNPKKKAVKLEKTWKFRTYDREFRPFSFFLVSDLHSKPGSRAIEDFLKNPKMKEIRFFGSLGDAGTVFHNFEQTYFQNTLNPLLAAFDSAVPLRIVRGNHEYWGRESELFADYFGMSGGRTFGAFMVHNVCFIVLDSGDTFAPSDVLYLPDHLLKEQRTWLAEYVKTPEYRNAEYRILLSHCALYGPNQSFMTDFMRKLVKDVFPTDRPLNLWFSGHIHNYRRTVPGKNGYYGFNPPTRGKNVHCDGAYAFPTVSLDGPKVGGVECSGAFVSVKSDEIEVETVEPNGNLVDRFAVDKAGRIREIDHAAKIRFFTPDTDSK